MAIVDLRKFDSLIYSYSYEEVPNQSQFFLHDHIDMELYYLVEGDVDFRVSNVIYHPMPGDMIITRPGELHCVHINTDNVYKRYNIRFSPELLKERLNSCLLLPFQAHPPGTNNLYLASELPTEYIRACLNRMFLHHGNDNKARATSYLIPILQELYDVWTTKGAQKEVPEHALLTEITAYINRHLLDIRSPEEICRTFHLSQSHLYRTFHEYSGTSIWNYVRTKRLTLAKSLIQSGMTPAKTAETCGFEDYSTFYRSYKRYYGCSPSADRPQSP